MAATAATAASYAERRARIEDYFDRTAAEAWARLTSDAPVGRIRRTVRAGRDEMRRTLLDWLPADLRGRRVAVIGTGPSAVQFVPALQPIVGHMDVYQRSPGWTVPKVDRKFNAFERWLLDTVPALHTLDRKRIFWWFEFLGSALQRQSPFNGVATAIFRNAARLLMNIQVKDPAMRRKLTLDYAIGCKRVLLSNK